MIGSVQGPLEDNPCTEIELPGYTGYPTDKYGNRVSVYPEGALLPIFNGPVDAYSSSDLVFSGYFRIKDTDGRRIPVYWSKHNSRFQYWFWAWRSGTSKMSVIKNGINLYQRYDEPE